MGRQAKGVRLIRLDPGQKLATIVAFEEEETPGSGTSGSSGDQSKEAPKKSAGLAHKMDEFLELEHVQFEHDASEEEVDEQSTAITDENVVYVAKKDDSEYDPFAGF